jgi:hypothetical protein
MVMWFELKINSRKVGVLDIQRISNTSTVVLEDSLVSTYQVKLDGQIIGHVEHRYCDGPWVLVNKASALAAVQPPEPVRRWEDYVDEFSYR